MTAQPLRIERRPECPVVLGLPGEELVRGRHVHFMGIGGAGVSALARLAGEAGATVSGCDLKIGPRARELVAEGCRVRPGHSPGHLDGVDMLVHTGAVRPTEPELLAARARGIETVDRLPMLLRMAARKRLLGVAGSHGKTTTTTLASSLLIEACFDPSCAVGGASEAVGGNARAGRGEFFVAELDESDGLIADASCEIAVLTNVDREHFDHYDSFQSICATFGRFLGNTSDAGLVVVCADSAAAASLARASGRRVATYGLGRGAEFCAERVALRGEGSTFDIATPSGTMRNVELAMPGIHNVQNATAVAALASELGIGGGVLRRTLARPAGIERRMEIHPLPGGARLIVDYAHHPAKVAALVASVGLSATGRVIAVFQPHRYTRTKHLGRDFGPAFAGWSPAHLPGTGTGPVDELIVLPIYAASEDSIPGVDSGLVARSARRAGVPKVRRAESFEQARAILARRMAPGDTVLLVGAGDVNALAEGLTDS